MFNYQHSLFRLGGIALALMGIQASVQEADGHWEVTSESFQVADDPYHGWKVHGGTVATEAAPPAIVLQKEGTGDAGFHHYLPFVHADASSGPSYLQIEASDSGGDENLPIGLLANVSIEGEVLGRFLNGTTTFNLAQYRAFSQGRKEKQHWALRLWSGTQRLAIKRITQSRELLNGVAIEIASQRVEGKPSEGDQLRVLFHCNNEELKGQTTLPAELIAVIGKKNRLEPWSGSSGPSLILHQESEGVYKAEFSLDEETVGLLAGAAQGAILGVRVSVGENAMIGWLYYPTQQAAGGAKIDWQNKIGTETGSHEQWSALMSGEELAKGKPVRYVPQPNYSLTTDEKDPYDLTDGALSVRKDDRIWFSKDAVGWYAIAGPIPMVTLLVDLEQVEPIGRIAIRLLAGREQSSLRLPASIQFFASEDGKAFHRLKQMQKLQPAERSLSDFKTNFYVPEEGTAFVHAFTCDEAVRARYVAIKIAPEGGVFSDEISIQRAAPRTPINALASYPIETFYREGVVARFRQPELTLLTGANVRNWITLNHYDNEATQQLGLDIDLPERLRIHPGRGQEITEFPTEVPGRRLYRISGLESLDKNQRIPIYFIKEGSEAIGVDEQVHLTTLREGIPSHRLSFPIRERIIEPGAAFDGIDISLAWLHDHTQVEWPDFYSSFRNLGFGTVSIFPRNWHRRNSRSTWIEEIRDRSLKFIAEARSNGFKVLVNESPFHVMVQTFESAKKEGVLTPEDAQGFYLSGADGQLTEHPNPFYRGAFYQKEIARVKRGISEAQPDFIFWDIELWWKSVQVAKNDPAINEHWKASGKTWDDYVLEHGVEMLRDLKIAVKDAMRERPMPSIGLYGAYATQAKPTDSLYDWKRIHPAFIDYAMPSLYVQGRTFDVHARIRDDYPLIGREIIPWLTAGTYGPVDPPAMETMVLETLLNGARGLTYYEHRDFDPLHFYYHARALSTLGKFQPLLKTGKPQLSYSGDNEGLSYTCYASEDEALILVGNYRRTLETKVTLPAFIAGAVTRQVRPGEGFGPEFTQPDWIVEVPAGQYVLFHQKRGSQTE